jgi:hypothetical protein
MLLAAGGSWLAMMTVHEFGHVAHAWLSGGHVERVVLNPAAFSRTDLAHNPHPLFVAWGGVVWGSAIPICVWLAAARAKVRCAFLLRFLAGFCLIANGAYLATAAALPVGDALDLVRLGAPVWGLALAGTAGVVGGLALWSPLGANFGMRENPVEPQAFAIAGGFLVIVAAAMWLWERGSWP